MVHTAHEQRRGSECCKRQSARHLTTMPRYAPREWYWPILDPALLPHTQRSPPPLDDPDRRPEFCRPGSDAPD
jgi:hypothetical protein